MIARTKHHLSLLPYLAAVFLASICLSCPAAEDGVGWLQAQAQPDGTVATANEPASSYQATTEVLLTIADYGLAAPVEARTYVHSYSAATTETIARKVLVLAGAPESADAFSQILTHINSDGGFAQAPGYRSSALDTAWGLLAIAAAGDRHAAYAESAVRALLEEQRDDGSFALAREAHGSVYCTAVALQAMSWLRADYQLEHPIGRAVSFIESQRLANNHWGSVWDTSSVLLALVAASPEPTRYAGAVERLRDLQGADGSWGGSVYATALALRALRAAESIPSVPAPVTGTIVGRIVDAKTGAALPGSSATVGAVRATAAPDGRFVFPELSEGDHRIAVSMPGYVTASMTVSVTAGQTLDAGRISLESIPDTGVISGYVTGAQSGDPIADAAVTAGGAVVATVSTDATGFFVLASAPGAVTLEVSATGYEGATGYGTVVAGGTLRFSPALFVSGTQPVSEFVTVRGIVLDDDSGAALSGVAVVVTAEGSGAETVTSETGEFILRGIAEGEQSIAFSKVGYRSASYSAIAGAGTTVVLNDVRLVAGTPPMESTIRGSVVDAETGEPVAGASVRIPELGGFAVSATDGSYVLEGVSTMTFTIEASAAGFASFATSVEVGYHGHYVLDVTLHRASAVDFEIAALATDALSYPALTRVDAYATLSNTGTTSRRVALFVSVSDSAGQGVERFPAPRVPLGGTPEDGYVTLEAGSERPVPFEWNTGRLPPGDYQLVVDAIEVESGRLLARRSTSLAIELTRRVGGSASFEPPITQLAAKTPIALAARVNNVGNETISPSSATARVSLLRQGYTPRSDLVEAELHASLEGL